MRPDRSEILVVSGEVSGDQHAAGLVSCLRMLHSGDRLRFYGTGGAALRAAGVELVHDISHMAAIGPWDALAHLGAYLSLFRRLVRDARQRKPRLAILVDFPEFNLRLARSLKKIGVPVCYFISPQVWAWRASRVEAIRNCVDCMLVIFPFEEAFYTAHGIKAIYVGNPSKASILASVGVRSAAEGIMSTAPVGNGLSGRPTVALLPGSRRKEVERIFPIMLDAARYVAERFVCGTNGGFERRDQSSSKGGAGETLRPGSGSAGPKFLVIKAPAVRRDQLECIYKKWAHESGVALPLEIDEGQSAHLLAGADCAIIKSGTSTLEATVLQVPFAMVYRLARPSWYLVRPFATTDTYCLTNLIAGEKVVPEFVQDAATGSAIGTFILQLLNDPDRRRTMRERLKAVTDRLGEGDAYQEAARWVSKLLLEGSTPR